jgi:hypothetical protein
MFREDYQYFSQEAGMAFGVFWVGEGLRFPAGRRPVSLWTCGRLPDRFGARRIYGAAGRRTE